LSPALIRWGDRGDDLVISAFDHHTWRLDADVYCAINGGYNRCKNKVNVRLQAAWSLVATMLRHVEKKAISLQIHNLTQKNILHSLHLFSICDFPRHGIGRPPVWRVGNPLCLYIVLVSFIDSREYIFRLPGTWDVA
jgi:hypothetical protein